MITGGPAPPPSQEPASFHEADPSAPRVAARAQVSGCTSPPGPQAELVGKLSPMGTRTVPGSWIAAKERRKEGSVDTEEGVKDRAEHDRVPEQH